LIRVLISNFLSNYFNFGNAFTEWCTKLIQYASSWSIKYMYHVWESLVSTHPASTHPLTSPGA